ncbi:MAG: AbrB/MazE/SpoVT family DNA-binding domain-containing protein [Promethearchaeota archaeon]
MNALEINMNAFIIIMMSSNNIVIVNSRGMITIPSQIRKNNNIKPGSKVAILNILGTITLVPILSEEEMQENLIPHEIMIKVYEESKKRDLEIEE